MTGLNPRSNTGTLVAYDPLEFDTRMLASDVYLVDMPLTPPAGSLLPYGASPEYSITRTVDVFSGEQKASWEGTDAMASANMVAFCQGKQLLIAPLTNPDDAKRVQALGSKTACVQGSWHGDTFAFVTIGSPTTGGNGTTLQLWERGSLSRFAIDISVFGIGPVSWSSDGTKLIYSVDGRIIQVSLTDKTTAILGAGSRAMFSPADPSLYSTITAEGSVEVRETTGAVVAVVRPRQQQSDDGNDFRPDDIASAWSPDGAAIAVVTPDCLRVWEFRTGTISCKVRPPQKEVFQPVALWFRPAP